MAAARAKLRFAFAAFLLKLGQDGYTDALFTPL